MSGIDLSRFDLNLLKAFDALERERNVTAAARRLHLGQPAMSHALARLRRHLDDELFVRSSSGMVPTPRAAALTEPIRAALAQIEGALQPEATSDAATTSQRFRIAMSDVVAAAIVPGLSAALRERAPAASIGVQTYDPRTAARRLDDGEIDLAIGMIKKSSGWHELETLYQEDFVCVFHPRQIKVRRPITLKQFVSYPHVLVTFAEDDKGFVDTALEKAKAERTVSVTSPYFLLSGYLLHALPIIATLPRRYAQLCRTMSDATINELPFPSPRMTISMIWHRRSKQNPASILLRQTVRDVVSR